MCDYPNREEAMVVLAFDNGTPPRRSEGVMTRLERIARAIHGRQQVNALTRDPDPAPSHAYESDPQSGAGNCVCGAAEQHRRHLHVSMPSATTPRLCTCGLPLDARCHAAPSEALRRWS